MDLSSVKAYLESLLLFLGFLTFVPRPQTALVLSRIWNKGLQGIFAKDIRDFPAQ